MPMHDHFRPPLDDVHSWDELHGMWPAVIVQHLLKILPEPYYAAPTVHFGTLFEVDVGTFRETWEPEDEVSSGPGGVAVYAPPKPSLTLEPRLPSQDVYEIRIFNNRRKRRVVAAIEIVSPPNKDRPESRSTFISKVAMLLKHGICVSIVDIVSTLDFNLYGELLTFVEGSDPALGDEPPAMYAATLHSSGGKSPPDGHLVSPAPRGANSSHAPNLADAETGPSHSNWKRATRNPAARCGFDEPRPRLVGLGREELL